MTAMTARAGLLTYGIPGFKLEKPVVMQRIEQLEAGGVQFVLNCARSARTSALTRSGASMMRC